MSEKQSLTNEDWDYLLGVESFKLGDTTLTLRPLNISEVKILLGVLGNSQDYFKEHNITPDNYHQPVQLIAIARLIMELVPQIISDTANLALADVVRLPPDPAVSLIRALIKINTKSKEGLSKNLTALATEIQQLMIPGGDLETSPNSLSQEDTDGKTSNVTPLVK